MRGLGRDTAPGLPGFDRLVRYRLARHEHAHQHAYLRQMEAATLHGQAAARAMLQLRQGGFVPDVIVAHPGWGETLYAKDVFPDARLLHYCEWYYSSKGADLGFDPEFPLTFDDHARVRTWNALHTLNLTHCDAGVAPTRWQQQRHPDVFLSKIVVQHEGIALRELAPDSRAAFATPSGQVVKAGDPVITYVARNLEPYRGFHIFMRALARIQSAHRDCHALIVGGDDVSYGKRPSDAAHWREKMLREVELDPARTHFLGRVPRSQFIRVLQVSAAHVYLTYPFVLSWSLLEAMACGALIVASNTAPVLEVLRHRQNAILTDFFDVERLANATLEALVNRGEDGAVYRRQACADATRFCRTDAVRGYDGLALTGAPPSTPTERELSLAALA